MESTIGFLKRMEQIEEERTTTLMEKTGMLNPKTHEALKNIEVAEVKALSFPEIQNYILKTPIDTLNNYTEGQLKIAVQATFMLIPERRIDNVLASLNGIEDVKKDLIMQLVYTMVDSDIRTEGGINADETIVERLEVMEIINQIIAEAAKEEAMDIGSMDMGK
ncbi:MAG: hypothetical protein A2Y24_01320 [Clostridiales bacterium GWE2_32_10]|nr:MAG: hypothetical protein A2Y24_01320 [Clostridiales bacterium GWE2_32_10]